GFEGDFDDEMPTPVAGGLRSRGVVADLGDGEVGVVALGEQVPQGRLLAFGATHDASADDIDDLVLDFDGVVDLVIGVGELAAQLLTGAHPLLDPPLANSPTDTGQ